MVLRRRSCLPVSALAIAALSVSPSPHGRRGGFGHSPILEQHDEED